LDGVSQTVTNTSPDHWFIDLAGVIGQQYWTEPETQRVVNEVQGQPLANRIFVNSELFLGFNGLTNGVMDTTSFTLNSNRVDVTFIDRGDVAHGVPDTATTLPLLSVSLGALAIFARRKQGKDGLRIL
jgi:hypothetical protein